MQRDEWRGEQRRPGAGWILGVAGTVLAGVLLVGCGEDPDPAAVAPQPVQTPQGRWRPAKDIREPRKLTPEQKEAMARLQSIGYLSGYEKAPQRDRVTRHLPEEVFHGYNLYTSGHAPEAILADMEGSVLHRWSHVFHEAFPYHPVIEEDEEPHYWRRVHLYDNGDLLAIYEGLGLVRLDARSRLLWASDEPAHHDLFVDEHGQITVLTREVKVLPRIHALKPVLEGYLTVMNGEGTVLRKVSLLEAFERSEYAHLLEEMPEAGDLFHTNTVEVLDGRWAPRYPAFAAGNVLISVLRLNAIAVVDMQREVVVWARTGDWIAQHQPTFVAEGNLLLFDNRGHHGQSRILEFDPLDGQVIWEYKGNAKESFYTHDCGSVQRLPNGNTLITESNSGRAFEVNRKGQIVWEFYNPARAGENGELIATLFELIRIPHRTFPWLRPE